MFARFRPKGAEPGQEKLPESWRIAVAAEKKNRPDENLLALITQSPEAMGAFAEENMSRMFLDPSSLRNTLDVIRARSGIEFSADAASRMAAMTGKLKFLSANHCTEPVAPMAQETTAKTPKRTTKAAPRAAPPRGA